MFSFTVRILFDPQIKLKEGEDSVTFGDPDVIYIRKEMGNKIKQIEEAQIELSAGVCRLSEADLRELCTELHIELMEEDTGRLPLTQTVTKYLDAEELDIKKLKELRVVVEQKGAKGSATKVKSEPDDKGAAAMQKSDAEASVNVFGGVSTTTTFKKEFKISGQIGDSSQKDRLSFTSLAHQINAGLNRGYKEEEVAEAVIRAVNPGMRITSYLEGKPPLTLANLRKIFRSHYQDKEVTEMYQLLSSGVQEGGETPKDFLVRLLDLKQKVLFASQEADSDLKYDLKVFHSTVYVLTLIADGSSKREY